MSARVRWVGSHVWREQMGSIKNSERQGIFRVFVKPCTSPAPTHPPSKPCTPTRPDHPPRPPAPLVRYLADDDGQGYDPAPHSTAGGEQKRVTLVREVAHEGPGGGGVHRQQPQHGYGAR